MLQIYSLTKFIFIIIQEKIAIKTWLSQKVE